MATDRTLNPNDEKVTAEEPCLYCGDKRGIGNIYPGNIPGPDATEWWTEEADYHAPDCEWLLTRAHRSDEPQV